MVYRVYVEKRPGLAVEAEALLSDIRHFLGITSISGLRILNRYDVENIDRALFDEAKTTVFSEPQVDVTYDALPTADHVFGVEYLPGQYDQRADSAAQCIQIISQKPRPTVRTAKIYLINGDPTADELAAIRKYVINPVEAREADLSEKETLATKYDIPADVAVMDGFLALDREGLAAFVKQYGLAMDTDDLAFLQAYFRSENREPTITEIRMTDTYWSDHCRHTTFLTTIDDVTFDDPTLAAAFARYKALRQRLGREKKPMNLMDIGTIAAKALKADGRLAGLDESEEINACTVKINGTVAPLIQERDAQSSDRDRTVRRCGNLYRRCDPGSAVRQIVCVCRDARDRSCRSDQTHCGHDSGQAPAEKARDDGGGRLFLLRQPDRIGDRTGG